MKEKIVLAATLFVLIATPSFARNFISPDQAKSFIGQFVTVEYSVGSSYNSGKVCLLNSKGNYRDPNNFVSAIFSNNFSRFSNSPEDYYLNKTIRVSGIIKEYKGKAEIIINSPDDIQIVEKKTARRAEKSKISATDRIIATVQGGRTLILNQENNTWEWL